jgi:hypothetical protein
MMKLAGLRTSRIARIFATGLVLSIIIGTLVFIWTLRLQEIGKWKNRQKPTVSFWRKTLRSKWILRTRQLPVLLSGFRIAECQRRLSEFETCDL